VERLLARSPSLVDAIDCEQMTALDLAAKAGHDNIVAQILLAHNPGNPFGDIKVDGDSPPQSTYTALHHAAENGHVG